MKKAALTAICLGAAFLFTPAQSHAQALGGDNSQQAQDVLTNEYLSEGQKDALRAYYENMSPAQKQLLKQRGKSRYESLNAEEKKAALKKAEAYYGKLSPEQKEAMQQKVEKRYDNLTDTQKADLKAKAEAKYREMSPAEQAAFRDKLQEMKAQREAEKAAQKDEIQKNLSPLNKLRMGQ